MMAIFADPTLLVAVAASFVAGLLGYIIIRMWIRPILQYQRIRRRLDRDLTRYARQLSDDDTVGNLAKIPDHMAATLRSVRHSARDLGLSYAERIPYWYRLLLVSRNTAPAEIEGLLTNLHKLKDRQQLQQRIARARQMAGLP
jgi:hypothetical protein